MWNGTDQITSRNVGSANSCQRISISGEANLVPFFTSLACSFSQQSCLSFSILETGKLEAISRTCNSPTHIGLLAEDLTSPSSENSFMLRCEGNTKMLSHIALGSSTVAFFVRSSGQAAHCINLIGGLTFLQLRWLFSNSSFLESATDSNSDSLKTWNDLHHSCASAPIKLAGPDGFSGTYAFFKDNVLVGMEHYDSSYLEFYTSTSLLEFVEFDGDAIGFFSFPMITQSSFLNIIPISPDRGRSWPGVEPGYLPNDPNYALAQPLFMIYQHESYDILEHFLEAIFSNDGQEMFQDLNYVRLPFDERLLAEQNLPGNFTFVDGVLLEPTCSATLRTEVIIFGTSMLLAVCVVLSISVSKIDFTDYIPDYDGNQDMKAFDLRNVPVAMEVHSGKEVSYVQYSPDKESDWGSVLSRSDSVGALDVFVNHKPVHSLASRFDIDVQCSIELRRYGDLLKYYMRPLFWQNTFCLIEPWEHVGHYEGAKVKASLNFCNFFARIMGTHTIILPIYSEDFAVEGLDDEFVAFLSKSGCIVMEGGDQSTYDPNTFIDSLSRKQLFTLTSKLLLSRDLNTCPQIYICLGHQCCAEAHIWILKDLCRQVEDKQHFRDLQPLVDVVEQIRTMGNKLQVHDHSGKPLCVGWENEMFAVSKMPEREVGLSTLQEFTIEDDNIPKELVDAYEASEVFMNMTMNHLQLFGKQVPMSHGDAVNPEAIIFANWAYQKLHPVIQQVKQYLIGTNLIWLSNLPVAVRILASSIQNDKLMCKAACTAIFYQKYAFPRILRTYTVQFHPELMTEDVGDLKTQVEHDYDVLSRHGHVLADMVFTCLHD